MDKAKHNIFVSSDIEGVAGLTTLEEANKANEAYNQFRQIMSNEVAQICNILSENNYKIRLKDAHEDGKNIIIDYLNEDTTVIRDWNNDLKAMCYGINKYTVGAILHGYHGAAGTDSPIAHTKNHQTIEYIKLNGEIIGETTISIYTCALFNIPVFFISGDKGAVLEAKKINPNIFSVITKEFDGNAVIAKSPKKVLLEIKENLTLAIENFKKCPEDFIIDLPKSFYFEIKFKNESHRLMEKEGAEIIDSSTISYTTESFQKFLEFLQ